MARDRLGLKDKTIALIEQQVEEQRNKLQRDIEQSTIDMKKAGLHAKLGEQKNEYLHRIKIIDEIKLQKQKQ